MAKKASQVLVRVKWLPAITSQGQAVGESKKRIEVKTHTAMRADRIDALDPAIIYLARMKEPGVEKAVIRALDCDKGNGERIPKAEFGGVFGLTRKITATAALHCPDEKAVYA